MGTEGLEPSRTITRQWILSPPCLPIPPHPLYSHIKYIKYNRSTSITIIRGRGGIGRHDGLKIRCLVIVREGSSPSVPIL